MKCVLSILFILSVYSSFGQKRSAADSVSWLLDTTISIMQKKALYADQVDWKKLQSELREQTKQVKGVKDAAFAFTRLFDELKDVHGVFYYIDTFFKSTVDPKNLHLINEVTMKEVSKGPRVVSQLVNGIAYLRIPVVIAQDTAGVEKMANRLNDSLVNMIKRSPRGVIIDLRLNQGGNTYPMVAGLHSLFEEGPVTGGWSFETKDQAPDIYFAGDSLITPYYRIGLNNTVKNTRIPVAVLIGPSTASAGECTAAALTFRKNVRFFGEETMGLTTANDGFMLVQPNIGFNLAVGVIKDGQGNKLYDPIRPDVEVKGGDDFSDLTKDSKVIKAMEWIRNSGKAK